MTNQSRHYFVTGNTAQGFVDKLMSNLQKTEKLLILRGRPGTGKACLMAALAGTGEKTGLPLEYLHCPSAPDTLDGFIIPELRLAVIDGTDLHYTKHITSFPQVRTLETDSLFDSDMLSLSDVRIQDIIRTIGSCHDHAFQFFADALRVHDEWEKIYIANMDFSKADLMATYTEELLFGGHRLDRTPVSKERFFGASTPSGAMDYLDNLTAGISKRYLLKGRPGTGKSTLLRKLEAASAARGLDTEVYSCAFDSNSLDAIIWPELDKCLFDSTAPHLYEPTRPNDELIDMYAGCVTPGTDEKYDSALQDIMSRYKETIQRGTDYLQEAKKHLDTLLRIYTEATDFSEVYSVCVDFGQLLHL